MAEDDDLIDPSLRLPLSSGRTIYANRGILGLGPDGGLYEGYDDGVDADLTPAERREIAEMMIARWRKFGGIDG